MARHVILHDRRLQGSAPIGRTLTTIQLDKSRSLFATFPIISTLGRLDGAQRFFILCHGYAGTNQRAGLCADMGGMGLELGREGVMHSNVARWSAIRGAVSTIVVYSCGAADTQPENVGTTADGKYLMGALALHTQATVYAADRIQWYTTGLSSNGPFNFGSWEGTLWKFEPSGTFGPALGNRVPLELGEVS